MSKIIQAEAENLEPRIRRARRFGFALKRAQRRSRFTQPPPAEGQRIVGSNRFSRSTVADRSSFETSISLPGLCTTLSECSF